MTSERGATLLETVVALAIGALVLSALSGTVLRAAQARERASRRAERTAAARTALLRVAQELEAAVGELTVANDGHDLRFTAAVVASRPADDVRRLEYRVEDATLVRRERSRFTTADPDRMPLAPGVEALRVRCFDGAEWRDAWTARELPRGVELAVDVADDAGGRATLTTRVARPVEPR